MTKEELFTSIDAQIAAQLYTYQSHPDNDLFAILEDIVYHGDFEAFKAVFETGVDVNIQNRYGWTPLHIAIRRNHRNMVEYLLDKGADINKVDGVGWTPLMEAIMDNMTDLCGLLVERGADKSIANQRGATAGMLVQKFGRQSMAQFF
ncbi:MAG: ankyrin repeat domain-containing protein [Campylobacterota bacterium]|nr:ankyrin repeat domain-containing protein [Campylobacterota bacterium]